MTFTKVFETDTPVLHDALPFAPWMDPRSAKLPGIQPADPEDWIRQDEAYADQMALRDHLISQQTEKVHALLPEARPAADELYQMTLEKLARTPGYSISDLHAVRPDGVHVVLDRDQPLLTLGRLVQEDLCILEAEGREHRLTGALLCFPASWTLAQKIGHPLLKIHVPVDEYDENLARRVQRLFDGVKEGMPLWRMNWLSYDDPQLHQPRLEGVSRPAPADHTYIRCERQVIMRLPRSRAVAFTIHTYIAPTSTLTAEEKTALMASLAAHYS